MSRLWNLEIIDTSKTMNKPVAGSTKSTAKPKSFHSSIQSENEKETTTITCSLCSGQHLLYQCKEFSKKTVQERSDFVQSNRLCFNCLAPSHSVRQCRQITSCRKCGRRHHSLLHFDIENRGLRETTTSNTKANNTTNETSQKHQPQNVATETAIISNHSRQDIQSCNVLLATAKVNASYANGYKLVIRALIDQSSQASFVTEETVQLLGLKKTRVDGCVSGIGDGQVKIKHMVKIFIESYRDPSNKLEVQAYVLNQLTSLLPTKQMIKLDWLQIEELADSEYSTPGRIDLLLGADVYCEILLEGIKKSPQGNLIAQKTTLGWIVSGKTSSTSVHERVITMHIQIREDNQLKKFWELEAEPNGIEKKLSKQDKMCEELYDATTQRK